MFFGGMVACGVIYFSFHRLQVRFGHSVGLILRKLSSSSNQCDLTAACHNRKSLSIFVDNFGTMRAKIKSIFLSILELFSTKPCSFPRDVFPPFGNF